MSLALIAIALSVLLAYAVERARKITLPPIETTPVNRRVYTPNVVIRAGHLVRVLEARRAVRGDDGYVKGERQ